MATPPSPPRRRTALDRLGQRLYVRIWLAVLLAVAVLTFLVGWAWQMAADPPLREVVVRNPAGDIVGSGSLRPPEGERGFRRDRDEREANPPPRQAPATATPPGSPDDPEADRDEADQQRRGPEFTVRMVDGQTLQLHLPRPPRNFWNRPPFGFFWTLSLVGIAVALATYPIIRKLTRRLEQLQSGVEQWGAGNLSARVPVRGKDEVAFLARRFNYAAEQIQTLVQSHKSLLANASHELRSPLARIRMGLELLGPQGSSTAREEISRDIAELDQLIDEILLASRLDAPEAPMGSIEPVDLTGLAAEECARIDAELAACDTPGGETVVVPGVSRLLRRVVRNLLENARRYSQGDITARVYRQGMRAVLEVSDRGPGVPPAQRERIFEPFYRLPGASEREGGVGLGLALVRTIVRRHGGDVRCGDRPDGSGAVFTVELPLQR